MWGRARIGKALISRQHGLRGVTTLAAARQAWGGRLVLSDEVEHALAHRLPIIALESTIISHGMPQPTNLDTALSVENIIRTAGVTPATIALLDGNVHVGLSQAQLERLADLSVKGTVKVSRRDMAPVLAQRLTGGTTVAGTMVVAHSVGIGMFVTGGIGGVHRGAEKSLDVSADLTELGRTPVTVICAGAKSILDIPKTLEYLETQGVCVATYAPTPDFPAFYSPKSGLKSPWHVWDTTSAAELIHTSQTLPTPLSTLLAVPIPEQHAEAGLKVQEAVEQAVRESIEQGVDKKGKEVTPWLLARVGQLTKGTALDLNVKLIENNARVGAAIALELQQLRDQNTKDASGALYRSARPEHLTSASQPKPDAATASYEPNTNDPSASVPLPSVLVFGSAAIDITSSSPTPLDPRTTTPGEIFISPGGVGRNIAEAAQRLLPSGAVRLVSAFGTTTNEKVDGNVEIPDPLGILLQAEMAISGLRLDGLFGHPGGRTAACSLTLDKSDLVAGVADMGIVDALTPDKIAVAIETVDPPPKLVTFDLNLPASSVQAVLATCQARGIATFCDPTSTPKIPRLSTPLKSLLPALPTDPRPLTHLSPNILELGTLQEALVESSGDSAWEYINSLDLKDEFRQAVARLASTHMDPVGNATYSQWTTLGWLTELGVVQQAVSLLPFVENLWIKAGPLGLVHVGVVPPTSGAGARKVGTGGSGLAYALGGVHEGKQLVVRRYPPPAITEDEIVSTTGAGDTLVGGLIAGLVGDAGVLPEVWVKAAMDGVGRTMRSRRAVG